MQCFFFNMGGFELEHPTASGPMRQRIRPTKLLELSERETIHWPVINPDEIKKRSSALEAILILQIWYFVAQIIGRAAQGLSVTLLELYTLGIIAFAVTSYFVQWSKPFDVKVPITIPVPEVITMELNESGRVGLTTAFIEAGRDAGLMVQLWTFLFTEIFIAMHVIGWNFYFLSVAEKWLWRVSSVYCITLPIIVWMMRALENDDLSKSRATGTILLALTVVYTTLGTYMVWEMFAGLRVVPASVYVTPQWSQYFPSFG
jgi:hypothetical protein